MKLYILYMSSKEEKSMKSTAYECQVPRSHGSYDIYELKNTHLFAPFPVEIFFPCIFSMASTRVARLYTKNVDYLDYLDRPYRNQALTM